jgi:carbohydrate-selective porin OprB
MQAFKLFAAITAITTLTLTFAVSAKGSDQNAEGPLKRIEALRNEIKNAGIDLQLTYTGEVFHSFDLVPDGATNYRGLVELALTLDTTKLGLWRDGEIFVIGQTGHGQGVDSAAAGNLFPISNIDGQDFTEISQYGVSQRFLDGKLQLQAGKQDVNSQFAVNDFGSQFVNPSYTLISNVPMPTFPAPALGLTVLVAAPPLVSVGAGIYDGGSKINSLGVDTAIDGQGGYFAILEPGWKPAFGADGSYNGN